MTRRHAFLNSINKIQVYCKFTVTSEKEAGRFFFYFKWAAPGRHVTGVKVCTAPLRHRKNRGRVIQLWEISLTETSSRSAGHPPSHSALHIATPSPFDGAGTGGFRSWNRAEAARGLLPDYHARGSVTGCDGARQNWPPPYYFRGSAADGLWRSNSGLFTCSEFNARSLSQAKRSS